ncbi:MAG: DNA mismatch repair protein MutS [Thermoplasmata archaeon]
MKVRLLFPDREIDPAARVPEVAAGLVPDLGLGPVLEAMAGSDEFLRGVVRTVVLSPVDDPRVLRRRQAILADFLADPAFAEDLAAVALEAHRAEREVWDFGERPGSVLYRASRLLGLLLPVLLRLRSVVRSHRAAIRSEGLRRMAEEIEQELDDAFFARAEDDLAAVRFPSGTLLRARLGPGAQGVDHTLRDPGDHRPSWAHRIASWRRSPLDFEVAPQDESGHRALTDLVDRGVATVARALESSAGQVAGYFAALRAEVGFFRAALALHGRLTAAGRPVAFPEPRPPEEGTLRIGGLYDLGLVLGGSPGPVVPNDVALDGARLVLITGANQGGKSTFLRSLAVAHLLMQAGLFVPARAMAASAGRGLLAHFPREEDAAREGGKLDEEMRRMARIVPHLAAGSLLFCNESFASTHEREGSEIADQILRALTERGVRIFFVTHLIDLAERWEARGLPTTRFLRAERTEDGRRTFRMLEAPPLRTSFGEDLYREVFPEGDDGAGPGPLAATG